MEEQGRYRDMAFHLVPEDGELGEEGEREGGEGRRGLICGVRGLV